jgi:predicted RNA-binding Zn ribbon-like protein
MGMNMADFMRDWLEHTDGPASDLDVVVLLLNSLDLLGDPPDRLTDLDWIRGVLAKVGWGEIGDALRPADVDGLRELRELLRAVFVAEAADDAAAILNPMLVHACAVPQLAVSDAGVRLVVAPAAVGLAALKARLPAAVAEHIADRGTGRLGVCAALPCQCAFVDHTRARTRRYCCTACNDRAAAKVYRQRKRQA